MLQYILPPVVIIVSLAVLVWFLSKRTSAIKEEIESAKGEGEKRTKKEIYVSKVSNASLGILEKMMRKLKLFFLKFHNFSDKITHSIKRRREKNRRDEEEISENEEIFSRRDRTGFITSKPDIKKEKGEIKSYPIISKEVVNPETEKELREKMEKDLVERIALNPKDVEAYERLGDYYFEQANYNDSLECFKQVLKLSPLSYKAKLKIKKLEKKLKK